MSENSNAPQMDDIAQPVAPKLFGPFDRLLIFAPSGALFLLLIIPDSWHLTAYAWLSKLVLIFLVVSYLIKYKAGIPAQSVATYIQGLSIASMVYIVGSALGDLDLSTGEIGVQKVEHVRDAIIQGMLSIGLGIVCSVFLSYWGARYESDVPIKFEFVEIDLRPLQIQLEQLGTHIDSVKSGLTGFSDAATKANGLMSSVAYDSEQMGNLLRGLAALIKDMEKILPLAKR